MKSSSVRIRLDWKEKNQLKSESYPIYLQIIRMKNREYLFVSAKDKNNSSIPIKTRGV